MLKGYEKKYWYWYDLKDVFIGKKVLAGQQISDTVYTLYFTGLSLAIETEGDCCSNSWIEHVENEDALDKAEILSIQHFDVEDWWQDGDGKKVKSSDGHERIQTYKMQIKTTKGYFEMEYRNSSNGYYGAEINYYVKEV